MKPRSPRSERSSPEALLALLLCFIVLFSSVVWMHGSPDYSQSFADLPADPRLGYLSRQERFLQDVPRPPLVVVIALDGLRSDRLLVPSHARDAAPSLNALARDAIVFTTVGAQSSQLLVSHKSLLTGKYPFTLLLEKTGADLLTLTSVEAPREYLTTAFTAVEGTLAPGLSERGYLGAAFTSSSWLERSRGFEHGFDMFDDMGGRLARILDRAVIWLDANADRDRFLFVESSDLAADLRTNAPGAMTYCPGHQTHASLEELAHAAERDEHAELSTADRRALADHYDGTLFEVDQALGAFFAALEERDLLDRTVLVLTSAHGKSLGESGAIGQGGFRLEQLVVPLVLKFPKDWDFASGVLDEPVELVDVLPTLFAVTNVSIPRDLDGRSLLPILFRGVRGKNVLLAQVALEDGGADAANPAVRSLLRPGRWQVIHDAKSEHASFFPLGRDPAGIVSTPIPSAEFATFFEALLEGPRRSARARSRAQHGAELSEALERELQSLGYAVAPGGRHH